MKRFLETVAVFVKYKATESREPACILGAIALVALVLWGWFLLATHVLGLRGGSPLTVPLALAMWIGSSLGVPRAYKNARGRFLFNPWCLFDVGEESLPVWIPIVSVWVGTVLGSVLDVCDPEAIWGFMLVCSFLTFVALIVLCMVMIVVEWGCKFLQGNWQMAKEEVARKHRSERSNCTMPPKVEAAEDALESREFYELMQSYRHMPIAAFNDVAAAYEDVKRFIRENFRKENA